MNFKAVAMTTCITVSVTLLKQLTNIIKSKKKLKLQVKKQYFNW